MQSRGNQRAKDVSVAKILVADDNSNIQKMVGLALKDQGIDVVAVGNGEAAVRKISDIKPDLVLADVFMPVRNGYEVCKYVKEDSALAHIPVILLVGAFDPLDEQEAQRVGADGVLKKPFVPPDPLISMVKSALTRAGVAFPGSAPEKPAAPVAAASMLVPSVPAVPASVPTVAAMPRVPEPAVTSDESFVEDVPARSAPVTIDSAKQPLAFGSLLETPGTEEAEEDLSFVAPGSPVATPERNWGASKAEASEEEEEEADEKPAWRRDAGDEDPVVPAGGPAKDWRTALEEPGPASHASTRWTPEKEKEQYAEAAEAAARALAEIRASQPQPSAPFTGDAWAAAIAAGSSEEKAAIAEAQRVSRESVQVATEEPVAEQAAAIPAVAKETSPEPVKSSAASSWFSTPPSPWDAEAQKATQLASTWDAPAVPVSREIPTTVSHESNGNAVSSAAAAEAAPVQDAISSAIGETVSNEQTIEETPAEDKSPYQAPATSELAETQTEAPAQIQGESVAAKSPEEATADAKSEMDALVARVMAKMSPEVLQAVTREILKPVVEAIVRNELDSKKS